MRRRSAKKSRHGCRECKRRHVKCDEGRPACANCAIRHSQCSFTSLLPIPSRPAVTIPSPSPSVASGSSSSSSSSGSSQSDESVQTHPSPPCSDGYALQLATPLSDHGLAFASNPLMSMGSTFKIHHLELLHNFRTSVLGGSFVDGGIVDNFMDMTVREAVQAPYLMDQVLALSAANMSTKRPHQRQFYQEEATQLQTRGVSLFATVHFSDDSDDDLAGFVFSTFLAQQVLFDAFTTRLDFPTFLDKFVCALHICGGVRVVCGRSWPFIIAQYRQQVGINLPGEYVVHTGAETILTKKLAHLETLLENAKPGVAVLGPCKTALGFLRDLSYVRVQPKTMMSQTTRVIQWAVLVPADFIKLIEQRRPEALVITAYYALLIHDSRDNWLTGDAGAFIIRSITRFLGKYWIDWLAWPNEVLDSADRTNIDTPFSPIDIGMTYRIDEIQ
ncbi:putative C6 finger domain-containing protein [Rosellinia necatrix]|uniref:Putative C6 finger domain-containing protein n=1 Tax=Rosellinia necatrix TaxID=77044 RepID=A0A1W2TQB4_ROSNE|nr:putative C6 finger domain-containing protein [Rosellinia necatrix]